MLFCKYRVIRDEFYSSINCSYTIQKEAATSTIVNCSIKIEIPSPSMSLIYTFCMVSKLYTVLRMKEIKKRRPDKSEMATDNNDSIVNSNDITWL